MEVFDEAVDYVDVPMPQVVEEVVEVAQILFNLFTSFILLILHVVETAEYQIHCAHAEWGVLLRGDTQPLTGYEPNKLDNSETLAAIFQDESVDVDTELSCSCDAELDDELIGKALSSPLLIQEREEPANLRQTYHSHEESLLPAQSFVTRTSTGRPENELRKRANQDSPWKTRRANFCWSQIWDPEARTSSRVW